MDLVLEFLNKLKINKNDSVVIGVSAGPDSMCLLDILEKLQNKIGFRIIVAHVNHNKREESVEEEEFLKNYCLDRNIIFESMKIESYSHDNFHKVARNIRYKFFKDLIDKYGASYLFTAHHGDDLMETILMRLTRGSSFSGYHGISLIANMDTYLIVRPLLYLTKEDINLYNESNNIPYRIDKSNFSDKYTRNRYRMNVLPFLKEENENVHLKFLKFSTLLEDANNYIEKVVDIAYNNIYKDSSLEIFSFLEYDLFIQKLIIEKFLLTVYSDLSELRDKHIELILDLVGKNKSGSMLNLPDNFICFIEYGYLKVKKNLDNSSYKIELKDGLILENGMKFVKILEEENGNDTIHLDSSSVLLPLYVRNKKEGDYIELKGMSGKKRVSDIFIDMKIPKLERASYPVVVDSLDRIVWIPKLKKSKYDGQNGKKCDIMFKCL